MSPFLHKVSHGAAIAFLGSLDRSAEPEIRCAAVVISVTSRDVHSSSRRDHLTAGVYYADTSEAASLQSQLESYIYTCY